MHLLGVRARSRAPVIWHVHDYLGSRPMTARLLRWHAARPAAVIANSASVAEDVRAALGPRVRVVPIYNGVDLDRFSPHGDRLDLDALSGLAPAAGEVVRVGLLGTFGRWKGHATFLQALARVPRTLPIRGYIIGGALYQTDASQYSRDELAALAASLGLADRVGFTGVVDRPEAALRALDIVVHASTEPEPFGLVIVEAMACGRAVVASDAGGAAEIITPGVDALAHRPGDAADLAEQIAALASDRYYRTRLGRAGRASAEHRFGRARLAAELVPAVRSGDGGVLMRVLHVYSGNLFGGVEAILVTLARHQADCPSLAHEFALCFEGRLGRELDALGAAVHRLPEVRASRPQTVRRARAGARRGCSRLGPVRSRRSATPRGRRRSSAASSGARACRSRSGRTTR